MILECKNIKKKYGKKIALDSVDICLEAGQVYGILGHNGAGKSTLIKAILGFIPLDEGDVKVLGYKPGENNSSIGYISENIVLYPHLSARDHFKISSLMLDVPMTNEGIDKVLEELNLKDNNKAVSSYSLGMKRRLQLGLATKIRQCDLLVLDEPTNGLDVEGLTVLKNYIQDAKNKDATVLIATHSVKEMEELINHYLIFDSGKMIAQGPWDKRAQSIKKARVEVDENLMSRLTRACQDVKVKYRYESEEVLQIEWEDGYRQLIDLLSCYEISPQNVEMVKMSLEDIYMDSIGKREINETP